MNKLRGLIFLTAIASLPPVVNAHETDDPLTSKVMIDQLEWRNADGKHNPVVLEAEAWLGYDLNKLWLKADIERLDGRTEEAELQALYSRAIAPYWDMQLGVRHDFKPKPEQTWAVIGIQGLAPYYFDVEAALFLGEAGSTAARFTAEYEMLFTQKLILSPEFSASFYGQNDRESQTGSGLSQTEVGLRLRYEIRREFAPYVGINWRKHYGNTADFLRDHSEDVSSTEFVVGARAWF